jgi:predicted esterase
MSDFTFPSSFKTQEISTNGATIHTRVGGAGPAVVLLHGYGETGDMWVPLAVDLARDHTVIVPISGGWDVLPNPPAGSTRRPRLATSSEFLLH